MHGVIAWQHLFLYQCLISCSGVGTVAATAVLAAALLQSIKNFIKN